MSDALFDLEALLKPVPGANPAGTDLRYDSVYSEIKAARLGDEANGIKPDWAKVAKLSATALEKRSKDLQVGVWLLEGVTREYDFAGAAEGLRCLARLVETYWECLYPELDPEDEEPLAYRVAVMSWVSDKLPPILKSLPLTRDGYTLLHYEVTQKTGEEKQTLLEDGWPSWEQFEQSMLALPLQQRESLLGDVEASQQALTDLETICNERFVTLAADSTGKQRTERLLGFHQVKDLLENCHWLAARAVRKKREEQAGGAQDIPAPEETAGNTETAPGSEESTAEEQPGPAEERSTAPAIGTAAMAPPTTAEEAFQSVALLARYLRDDNPYRPIPYLLTRAVAWGHLFGFERIADLTAAAPETEIRKRLKDLYQQADWNALLNESEEALIAEPNRAWVDLHRYGLQALQNLGYERAALVVGAMFRALIQTHPDLLQLELADGTPAAGPESQKWIKEEGLLDQEVQTAPEARLAEHREAVVSPAPDVASESQSVWEAAVGRLKKKDFAGGLQMLQAKAGSASSGRERFLMRLEMAEFCLLGSRQNLAFPILDDLVRTIDEFHLEHWEDKELVTRTWIGFVRCCETLGDYSEEKKKRAGEIFDRLCRLDITKALSVEK